MSDDLEYFDEEIAALGGNWTILHCDECGSPFEVLDDIADEMTLWQSESGDPIVCPVCEYQDESNFFDIIRIDKEAKHYRCPECKDVMFSMTDNHVLCCSVDLVSEIDVNKLPANFDPEALPLKYCPDCLKDAALEEAEALLGVWDEKSS